MNSGLQKENDQFVSILLTYMKFHFNYCTIRLRTTKDTTIVPKVGTDILRRKKTINVLGSSISDVENTKRGDLTKIQMLGYKMVCK